MLCLLPSVKKHLCDMYYECRFTVEHMKLFVQDPECSPESSPEVCVDNQGLTVPQLRPGTAVTSQLGHCQHLLCNVLHTKAHCCLQRVQFLVDAMHDATVGKAGRPVSKATLQIKLRKKMEFTQKQKG